MAFLHTMYSGITVLTVDEYLACKVSVISVNGLSNRSSFSIFDH